MSVKNNTISVLSQRYAKALFDQSLETKSLDKVHAELSILHKLIQSHEDLSASLTSQTISNEDQKSVILAVAHKAHFSKTSIGFLTLIADNNRLNGLGNFISKFFELVEEHKNIAEASVTSAIKLSTDHIKSIQDILKKKYKKEIKLSQVIDKNLIGGVVVRMGSMMFDNSIKNKIRNLHLTMKEAE